LVDIRCYKCGGKASGDTFEDARTKLNHAVGKSRGIKCGDNYNCIEEIKDSTVQESTTQEETPKAEIPEPVNTEPVSSEASYKNVEGKTGEHVTFDESTDDTKQSKKKSKNFSY